VIVTSGERASEGISSVTQAACDLINEADVSVVAGSHARDDLAPCDLGVDDGFAAAAAVIDRHDKILHALRSDPIGLNCDSRDFQKSEIGQASNSGKQK
jgi:hypothetical protein